MARLLATLILCISVLIAHGGNPPISVRYSADPSAHVWPSEPEKLWIYASHDQHDASTFDTMDQYWIYSTTDMVNFEDHGLALHLDNVSWANSRMWAPDAVFWKGKYYLIFCAIENATEMFRTGLAISDTPGGPFTDIGFIEGVVWGQDPCLFVDDDGTPYLYWGLGGNAFVVQLSDDLRKAVEGTLRKLTNELPKIYEGPWVFKRHGIYYMMYPALHVHEVGERLEYASSPTPYGPWVHRGMLMNYTGLWTNHGSIQEFRGQWYMFYHMDQVSGTHLRRNVAIEPLHWNEDGTIQEMTPTVEGAAKLPPPDLKALHAHVQKKNDLQHISGAVVKHLHARGVYSVQAVESEAIQAELGNATITQQQRWIMGHVREALKAKHVEMEGSDAGGSSIHNCAECDDALGALACAFHPSRCVDGALRSHSAATWRHV